MLSMLGAGGNFIPTDQQIASAFHHFIMLNVRMIFFFILITGNQRLFHHIYLTSFIYSNVGN